MRVQLFGLSYSESSRWSLARSWAVNLKFLGIEAHRFAVVGKCDSLHDAKTFMQRADELAAFNLPDSDLAVVLFDDLGHLLAHMLEPRACREQVAVGRVGA